MRHHKCITTEMSFLDSHYLDKFQTVPIISQLPAIVTQGGNWFARTVSQQPPPPTPPRKPCNYPMTPPPLQPHVPTPPPHPVPTPLAPETVRDLEVFTKTRSSSALYRARVSRSDVAIYSFASCVYVFSMQAILDARARSCHGWSWSSESN